MTWLGASREGLGLEDESVCVCVCGRNGGQIVCVRGRESVCGVAVRIESERMREMIQQCKSTLTHIHLPPPRSLPHGPAKFSHVIPNLVETSNNVASIKPG